MIQKPKPKINDAFAPTQASPGVTLVSAEHRLIDHFRAIDDPRIERSKRHLLIDIIIITVLAVICGADGWVGVATFGEAKYHWLKTFLALPNGIPSHDTFGDVFARLDPEQLQQCFLSWVRSVSQLTHGEVIAIDGKT
ncbi:MAG: ISAs1 family transposase, partial [Okeania sp. SIO3C4]|nr:ISAs1 family transposase [Okeania sp. SIO3C4]